MEDDGESAYQTWAEDIEVVNGGLYWWVRGDAGFKWQIDYQLPVSLAKKSIGSE